MQKEICTNIVFIVEHCDLTFYRLCAELRFSHSLSTRIKENTANLTIEKIAKISGFFKVPPFIFWLPSKLFRYIVIKKRTDQTLSFDDAVALIIEYTKINK